MLFFVHPLYTIVCLALGYFHTFESTFDGNNSSCPERVSDECPSAEIMACTLPDAENHRVCDVPVSDARNNARFLPLSLSTWMAPRYHHTTLYLWQLQQPHRWSELGHFHTLESTFEGKIFSYLERVFEECPNPGEISRLRPRVFREMRGQSNTCKGDLKIGAHTRCIYVERGFISVAPL